MGSLEDDAVKRRALEAINEAVAGSDWAPPEGGLVVEAVVVMVWALPDGSNGMSFLPATNHWWSTSGLLEGALRRHHKDAAEDEDE